MQFKIYRTSDWLAEIQPSAQAQKTGSEQVNRSQYRAVWTVEINTLEDLLALRDEVGESLIVGEVDGIDFIEIYDDHHC